MTKQEVLDLIATNLATGSNITAAEHRAVEEAIVDYVGLSTVAYGRIGPIDIANTATSWPVTGNLTSATRVGSPSGGYVEIRVTIPSGLLTSNNFKIRSDVESAGTGNLDNDMLGVLFKKDDSSTTTFRLLIEESPAGTTSSIFLHVEVVQL
jgi:hypothetical protein